MSNSAWNAKGGALSDKTARKEYGLERDEIIEAINAGKLRHRVNYIHGNPYFRLLRHEVEEFVREKYGEDKFQKRQLQSELAKVKTEIRSLKIKLNKLERKKTNSRKSWENKIFGEKVLKKLHGHS